MVGVATPVPSRLFPVLVDGHVAHPVDGTLPSVRQSREDGREGDGLGQAFEVPGGQRNKLRIDSTDHRVDDGRSDEGLAGPRGGDSLKECGETMPGGAATFVTALVIRPQHDKFGLPGQARATPVTFP